jgi:hypothetical protein
MPSTRFPPKSLTERLRVLWLGKAEHDEVELTATEASKQRRR